MRETILHPIGVIRTPHRKHAGTPVQPTFAEGAPGTITVFDPYVEALRDLDGFERIWLVFEFDRAKDWSSLVVPYRDVVERGLFATRAPSRPNPIGLSAVRLVSVDGNTLHVADVDMLDGTPLLDIKPYLPSIDAYPESRAGWVDAAAPGRTVADERFEGRGGDAPGRKP